MAAAGQSMHHMATGAAEPSFELFIDDSSLLVDDEPMEHMTNAAMTTPKPKKGKAAKTGKANALSPLSALPSRLSMANVERHSTPSSPGGGLMSEFLHYAPTSGSAVTTPTTSNGSSLHNLSFDLFDGSDGSASVPAGTDTLSPEGDLSNVATPSATSLSTTPNAPYFHDVTMDNVMPGMAHLGDSFYPTMLANMPMHSFQRTVDDMGHQFGGQHTMVNQHGFHHHRSLSLRDMNPAVLNDIRAFTPQALATYGLQTSALQDMPSFSVPQPANSLSVPLQTVEEQGAKSKGKADRPPKKRKLTAPSTEQPVEEEAATAAASTEDNDKTAKGKTGKKATNGARRSRSNTVTGKKGASLKEEEPDETVEGSSLMDQTMDTAEADLTLEADQTAASIANDSASPDAEDGPAESGKPVKKPGTKRPPPSAFQITEAGMPFPVIDTSTKHSSLFVPPDTSGLTKREARLVKNRAAAFLSRQRKREQFEELEIKCKALCRLIWTMWEAGSTQPFADQAHFSAFLHEREGDEIQEIFDLVLALKGGSVAPTEDGQLQGAVAAGIASANGKIIGDASAVVHVPSSAALAAEEASKELARLRAELDEQRRITATLEQELAQERTVRLKMGFDLQQLQEEQKPFRGAAHQHVALTEPARLDEDEEEAVKDITPSEAAQDIDARKADSTSPSQRRGAGNQKASRTSKRISRQMQDSAPDSTAATSEEQEGAASQRKAAGAALMMVLFSFALFGLPGGQVGTMGGIASASRASSQFPLGRVLGAAPLETGGGERHSRKADVPPSSHLSVDDLFPALEGSVTPEERDASDALPTSDFHFDYHSFAKDLGNSLDWDMQRGFLVLGGDGMDGESDERGSSTTGGADAMQLDGMTASTAKTDLQEAPTKLTLFVPAPDVSAHTNDGSPSIDGGEDRFYDAPLAHADHEEPDLDRQQRDLTQVEATRAALQVLRNHRVAQEAALAASRRYSQPPSPSTRLRSPTMQKVALQSGQEDTDATVKPSEQAIRFNAEEGDDDEEDFSQDVLQPASASASDRIRGTDFYQLEFSLSGAKVRNVAELTRLLASMRHNGANVALSS